MTWFISRDEEVRRCILSKQLLCVKKGHNYTVFLEIKICPPGLIQSPFFDLYGYVKGLSMLR